MISIIIISKDEPSLDNTLTEVVSQANQLDDDWEVIVVDASDGRLDYIQRKHQLNVRWIQFNRSSEKKTTIPCQRNAGVKESRGDIIVFTDAGCHPESGWLIHLVTPIYHGEYVTAGPTLGTAGSTGIYDSALPRFEKANYLHECGSGNLAFRREAFDLVGGFDEHFTYGSDIDFSWRLADAGYLLRSVPDAVIRHDWGSSWRQLRRSYVYGKARIRLYKKHTARRRKVLRHDPMVVVYPAFLIGLPVTLIFPLYPALLIIPAWRNRSDGAFRVLVDHLAYGYGALVELVSP